MKPKTRGLASDLSGVNAGRARLAADEQSAEARAAARANARGNMAAMVIERRGIDPRAVEAADLSDACKTELREVAEALGIARMPTPGAVQAAPTPCSVPAPSRVNTTATGWCRACDRTYRLDGDRRLRPHPAWETRDGARFRLPWDCGGTGRRPEDVEAP